MKAVMLTNDWGSMWESNCQNSGEDLIFLVGRLVIGCEIWRACWIFLYVFAVGLIFVFGSCVGFVWNAI
jgi:hypothetical protein